MEAVHSTKKLVNFYQTTQSHIPEDSNLHNHCSESLKLSRLMVFREILAAYFENHTKPINTLWVKMQSSVMLKLVVRTVTDVLSRVKHPKSTPPLW
jgi:hypothetical protein